MDFDDEEFTQRSLTGKLKKYVDELAADTQIDETNIHDKTLLKSTIGAKWARYSYEEELNKKSLIELAEKFKEGIAQKLYETKKNAVLTQTVTDPMIKLETEKLLKRSDKYKQIQTAIQEQDDILRFIVEAKQIISQMTWDIKNAIEILKLEKF